MKTICKHAYPSDLCGICNPLAKEKRNARRSAAACSLSYLAGMDCQCGARSESECGCPGVDWTPSEVIKLRQTIEEMEIRHAATMLHTQTIVDEANAMREWIMQAAPMLSAASCIVIDEAVDRLGEIAGCLAVLELCPVDFISSENDKDLARRALDSE